jgi:methylthioribose-1-phosphate isomerase
VLQVRSPSPALLASSPREGKKADGIMVLSSDISPAFDVTPADLIDCVVTEKRVVENVGGKIDMS